VGNSLVWPAPSVRCVQVRRGTALLSQRAEAAREAAAAAAAAAAAGSPSAVGRTGRPAQPPPLQQPALDIVWGGDMNWIAEQAPPVLPSGWQDAWVAVRQASQPQQAREGHGIGGEGQGCSGGAESAVKDSAAGSSCGSDGSGTKGAGFRRWNVAGRAAMGYTYDTTHNPMLHSQRFLPSRLDR
jgi:hypothetical protein